MRVLYSYVCDNRYNRFLFHHSPKDIVNLKNEIERRAKEGEGSTETESKTLTDTIDSATSSNTQAVEQQATSSSWNTKKTTKNMRDA